MCHASPLLCWALFAGFHLLDLCISIIGEIFLDDAALSLAPKGDSAAVVEVAAVHLIAVVAVVGAGLCLHTQPPHHHPGCGAYEA